MSTTGTTPAPGGVPPHGRWLEIHGARLYLEEHGRGTPLILVHGGLGSGAAWGPLLPTLVAHHRVLVPDSRGHGRSTNPAGRLSYPALADDLAALIALLGLESPAMAGWSDGGQIVLELAVRHPGMVGPIVVGGAHPDFVGTGLRETHRRLLGADTAGNPDLAHLDTELGAAADEIKALHPGGPTRWRSFIEQTASMYLHYDGIPAEDVARIDQPALILAGDRDELVPLDLATALYRALPHGELAVAPATDHGGPLSTERGPLVAALIRDFTTRHTH
jgi:pimeloyl-ACP methyl ester carboxylesterase